MTSSWRIEEWWIIADETINIHLIWMSGSRQQDLTWQDQCVHVSNGGDPTVFQLGKEHTFWPSVSLSPNFTLNCISYIIHRIHASSSLFLEYLQLDIFVFEMFIGAHQALSTRGSSLLYWSLLVTPHPIPSPIQHFPFSSLLSPSCPQQTEPVEQQVRLYDWSWALARGAWRRSSSVLS